MGRATPGGHGGKARRRLLAVLQVLATLLCGCGAASPHTPSSGIPAALLERARPIGAGARFQPPAAGAAIGRCTPALGARIAVHVEVFAANRVVIVAAGVGARGPLRFSAGQVIGARCYGDLVTLEPTGVVLVRAQARLRLSSLFHAWGQPLSPSRLASFRAPRGTHVSVFVDGRRWQRAPGDVPLSAHAEIVLEVGPHVPPHSSYTFPAGS
jgi:hypothetical protein